MYFNFFFINIDLRHCLNTQHGILSQTYRGGYNARLAITKVLPFVGMKPLLHGKASIIILVS